MYLIIDYLNLPTLLNIYIDNINSNLLDVVELDIDIILNFFYNIAPDIDSEICLKYLKLTLEKIYNSRKDYNSIVNKDWLDKNIKLYQTIGEYDIRKNNENFPLQTILPTKSIYFIKCKLAVSPEKFRMKK